MLLEVNNAGILEMGSIENTTLETYDRIMNVNVRSIFQLTNLLVPMLAETRGSIVSVSSVNGIRSVSNSHPFMIDGNCKRFSF